MSIFRNSYSIGAEGGWMNNWQIGSFQLVCKCPVPAGSGSSGIGALFYEVEKNKYISFGMKIGLEHQSTSSSTTVRDTAVITYIQQDSVASGAFTITRKVDVSATYFFFAPYLKASPFGEGLFIQIAAEYGILTSSRLTHARIAPNMITLSNGQAIKNVKFENGSQQEVLQDGSIPDVRNSRIALLFGIGYDIPIFTNFSLLPQASYNYPLTELTTNPNESGWKISSFVLMLGLKYKI